MKFDAAVQEAEMYMNREEEQQVVDVSSDSTQEGSKKITQSVKVWFKLRFCTHQGYMVEQIYEMTGFSCRFSTKGKLFQTRRKQRTITVLIVGLLLNLKMV